MRQTWAINGIAPLRLAGPDTQQKQSGLSGHSESEYSCVWDYQFTDNLNSQIHSVMLDKQAHYKSMKWSPGSFLVGILCWNKNSSECLLCACSLTSPFAFGFFHLQQLEGDLETLAIVTYSLVSLSLLCLLLSFSFLICLKGLKSNTRGIHCNISVTLFFSELIFLLGINRTETQVRGERRARFMAQ